MSKNQMIGVTTAEPKSLVFVEDAEAQIVLASTPKRKQRIKIFVPVGGTVFWRITYEDGKAISSLSEGVYTSRGDAMKAVTEWERRAKKTEDAKQFELFGDKEPPVLKRKKTRGARV